MKKFFVMCLLFFAAVGLVAAEGNETFGMDLRQAVMEMHAAQLECRVDFLVTMLEYSEGYTGESYDEIIANLQLSMEEVQQAADENNLEAFGEAVAKTKGYFREAVQTIHDARVEAIKNSRENKSELMAQMREDFDSAHKEFVNCHVEATRNRISAEIKLNRYWIDAGEEVAKNMREKGYDTTKLEKILDEAKENTDDMEKILKNKDTATLLEERKTRWEHHLYLWAKYHKERLSLFLDRILEKTDGYEERVGEIRELLEKAVTIGEDEYYTPEEFREARAYILEASDEIRELVDEIKGGVKEGGKEE
ncbi:MAG: hypothetical protein QXG02_02710 [Candidatus Anstonellales archaeon]